MKTFRKITGSITIGTVLTLLGGMFAGTVFVFTTSQTAVAPIKAEADANATAIAATNIQLAAYQQKVDDADDKINAVYNFFLTKGMKALNNSTSTK